MSELGDIHEKINRVDNNVSYLKGQLDTLIPGLVTDTKLSRAISEHAQKCRKSLAPRMAGGSTLKIIGGVVALLTALVGLAYALQ